MTQLETPAPPPRNSSRNGNRRRARRPAFTDDPLWYQDAVIYQLHIKSFYDADGDGIGDFRGLMEKLDYIVALGVNTLWLLPFYPSPRRDDGYDIADYRGVHPDYGTLADARRFIAAAHARGLRVITELVVNHTSDQHPWFQRARLAKPGSAARDFYVWSDTDKKYAGTRIIFLDTEKSNWTWDPVAGAYYWHRFYSHQPDLNYDNPQVLKAVLGVLRYWLELGVDGLRLDAVPYLIEREGTNNENLAETHAVLKRIRAEVDAEFPGRMLLAEANQWPEDTQEYFGAGDECHMAFHFPLMPRMYMALAQEDRFPITDILRQTPAIPPHCQWAIFLRNHDELTLEMVTDRERDYLWEKYASERRARINLGIRRRLAPLMENDRRRVELLNSLLLSMPGTPIIYYGDEILMGDNIYLGDRDGVRTPMQWSPDRNGGFSRAAPSQLVLPPNMDSLYGYGAINVEAQTRDQHSMLNWMRRLLDVRKRHQVFGRGSFKLIYPTNRRILAYLREFTNAEGNVETVMCVANMARSAQAVELDLAPHAGLVPVEMLGGASFPPIGQLPYLLTLQPYGFYWFLLASNARMPAWHTEPPEPLPEYLTLILRTGINDVLAQPARSILEQEVLPGYLPKRRWFAAKGEALDSVRIAHATLLSQTQPPMLLAELEVATEHGEARYQLPLAFIAEEAIVAALPQQLALARVRRGARVGYLTDAFTLPHLGHGILRLLREGAVLPVADGELHFIATPRLAELQIPADAETVPLGAEQSNSSVVVGDAAIIKLFRRLAPGTHPEAEMGHRLTAAGFQNASPLLGEISRVDAEGNRYTLAVVQGYRHSQGDAWAWTLARLERLLQGLAEADPDAQTQSEGNLEELLQFAAVLGRRLGELHTVLAAPIADPAFKPEPASSAHCRRWAHTAHAQLEQALALLAERGAWPNPDDRRLAEALLRQQRAFGEAVQALAAAGTGSLLTRTHGDLHLGQVLVSQDDAYFIDFEGEPARSLAERRAKTSPLRDVAGMLRSFAYAAAMAGDGRAREPAGMALVQRYLDGSQEAFLAAYAQASATIPHQWSQPDAAAALLDLFALEKAAYEIAYEAANRPAWLPIPLRGLGALARRLGILTETGDRAEANDAG